MREVRSLPTALEADGNTITGYASVFHQPSEILSHGGKTFREEVAKGAFKRSLESPPLGDIVALWQHNDTIRPPLGRTSAGTLKLHEDAIGLRFTLTAPNWASDIVESVKRGDVWGMSFGMLERSISDSWTHKNGMAFRTLHEVGLDEISLVVRPAYPSTSVSVRNMSQVVVPDLTDIGLLKVRTMKAKWKLK